MSSLVDVCPSVRVTDPLNTASAAAESPTRSTAQTLTTSTSGRSMTSQPIHFRSDAHMLTKPTSGHLTTSSPIHFRCDAQADHVHFRSVDDVTADTLPAANHTDARRSALKSPPPMQVTNVSPCSGRLVNTSTSNTAQRSSLNNRSMLRPSPLAETDI